ncbi:hypothetical protein SAMN04489724_0024 [Algoriphagus locisalis]|uniref:Uncharacterized protein n=1 Tax=Algoriphagus locisalis TaxID=305507 RepID=A0A1I7E4L6_9BACT|nr:hypothetical protein SAMN04489724_0024 [Algoriphagus locisalis]
MATTCPVTKDTGWNLRMNYNHPSVCRFGSCLISYVYNLSFKGHNLSRDEGYGMESRRVNNHQSPELISGQVV